MVKPLVLMSMAFILCNCASQQPNSEAATPASNPGMEQQTASMSGSDSKLAQIHSGQSATDSSVSSKNKTQAVSTVETAEPNASMEVVEVEGIREEHCTVERITGSRIPKKYCRTVAVDDLHRENARKWLDNIKSTSLGNPTSRQ